MSTNNTAPNTPPAPSLQASIEFTDRGVSVDLEVSSGETLTLWGANGTGKSTVLDCLGGWLIPDAATVRLGERVLLEKHHADRVPRTLVAARDRSVGYLNQRPQLFPHLNVLGNISYGMRRAGITTATERRAEARRWLERLGIAELGRRRPHQLSGGQAQRVAIARVLASGPRLLLLDEPLAALDVTAAVEIRELLAGMLTDYTTVLVTHDHDDIAALANRVQNIQT